MIPALLLGLVAYRAWNPRGYLRIKKQPNESQRDSVPKPRVVTGTAETRLNADARWSAEKTVAFRRVQPDLASAPFRRLRPRRHRGDAGDVCAGLGIVSDIEMIRFQQINEACERLLRGDGKYGFVLDMTLLR